MGTVGIYIHYILHSLVLILYLKCGGGGCNVFLTFYAISNIYRKQIWEYKPIISHLMFSRATELPCFISNVWSYGKKLIFIYLLNIWLCTHPNKCQFLARCAKWQRSFSNAELSVCLSVRLSVRMSVKIEGGGGANLRNALVTFSLFWHEASLG